MTKAIVLRAAGTNTDLETVYCLKKIGFKTDLVHVNQLIRKEKFVHDYNLLVLPGGFANGDYLGSAKVLANKLSHKLNNDVPEFIESGNLVLGICNGFQALIKSGLLPGFDHDYKTQKITIAMNDSGHFQDQWVELKNVNKGKCIFTKDIDILPCPINHGEGKFFPESDTVLKKLYYNDQVVFKYLKNPNGSVDDIAGICDETGRVFGLMPHPEKFHSGLSHPLSTRQDFPEEGLGMKIFKNAFDYLK